MNASFVVDTHPLGWFIAKSPKLSAKARELLRQAERGEVQVLVPTLVLAELLSISEKKRVPITMAEVLRTLEEGMGFGIVPFDFLVFEEAMKLPRKLELHDRIIAATALVYRVKLLSKDEELRKLTKLELVW